MKFIHDIEIYGSEVDAQTRCEHYRSDLDVIAIKFKCCGVWFPCHLCHSERENHPAKVWTIDEYETRAVLCGVCGHQLTIAEYLGCDSVCPRCRASFNPKCAAHYELYFEV